MDTAQEQRKRKLGTNVSSSGAPAVDVFDKLGNDGLQAHVAQARTASDPSFEQEEASVLSLAAEEVEGPEVAAPDTGIDPVLAMEPGDLGSSDLAKDAALGVEGHQILKAAVTAAAATLGGRPLDNVALKLVGEQIRSDLEVEDILEARKEGRLDALVRSSLRRNALRSRDEVIFLLQQLSHEDGQLTDMLLTTDPGLLAVDLVEYLAVNLVDLGDLYALAAYDHGDILNRIVIGDQAIKAQKTLSPLALRMGGFATVLYQLVVDELAQKPLPNGPTAVGGQDSTAVGESDPATLVEPYGQNLMSLVALLRQFRTAAA